MADEAATAAAAVPAVPPPPAVVAPLVEIWYGIDELTSAEVIHKITEYVSHNKQIKSVLEFPARDDFDDVDDDDENYERLRFDATVAMQNKIVENSRHIQEIVIHNYCTQQDEHIRCFTYFTRIVRGIIGNGKHFRYINEVYEFEFDLEQANKLAEAIVQSKNNNNNDDAIESFEFNEYNLTPVTLQPVLDALLDSGVRKITFGNGDDVDPPINNNNNGIDFTGIETNKSLKLLDLNRYRMREEDFQSLFHSLKKNKGLEKLRLNYATYKELPEETKRLFQEMMCENITLLNYFLRVEADGQDGIFVLIQFHLKMNRMWKRYILKREEEKKTRTVITRIEEGDNKDNTNNNNNNNEEEEEERKKRLKMRLLLNLFMKKTVMRDTIIFHLLREYPDDLVSNNNNTNNEHPSQNPLLLRIMNSNLAAKNKRKTTTNNDGDTENNDGTDDNDGDSASASEDGTDASDNDGDSESDDGTDGTKILAY